MPLLSHFLRLLQEKHYVCADYEITFFDFFRRLASTFSPVADYYRLLSLLSYISQHLLRHYVSHYYITPLRWHCRCNITRHVHTWCDIIIDRPFIFDVSFRCDFLLLRCNIFACHAAIWYWYAVYRYAMLMLLMRHFHYYDYFQAPRWCRADYFLRLHYAYADFIFDATPIRCHVFAISYANIAYVTLSTWNISLRQPFRRDVVVSIDYFSLLLPPVCRWCIRRRWATPFHFLRCRADALSPAAMLLFAVMADADGAASIFAKDILPLSCSRCRRLLMWLFLFADWRRRCHDDVYAALPMTTCHVIRSPHWWWCSFMKDFDVFSAFRHCWFYDADIISIDVHYYAIFDYYFISTFSFISISFFDAVTFLHFRLFSRRCRGKELMTFLLHFHFFFHVAVLSSLGFHYIITMPCQRPGRPWGTLFTIIDIDIDISRIFWHYAFDGGGCFAIITPLSHFTPLRFITHIMLSTFVTFSFFESLMSMRRLPRWQRASQIT